jgi:hypothetical protein
MTPIDSARTWAFFVAATSAELQLETARQQTGRRSQYLIREMIPVAGAVPPGLARALHMLRIESDSPCQPDLTRQSPAPDSVTYFQGVTQDLNYTTAVQRRELEARSRAGFDPSGQTTAVLIPIGKSPDWWRLDRDRRQAHFQPHDGWPGHTAIGIPFVDRVYRKLYHAHPISPRPPYDFLTYFEFNDRHRPDFRLLLDELRHPERSPEWAYVVLEYEIWMTKIG